MTAALRGLAIMGCPDPRNGEGMAEGGHQVTVMLSSRSVQKLSSFRKNLWPRLFLQVPPLGGARRHTVTSRVGAKSLLTQFGG